MQYALMTKYLGHSGNTAYEIASTHNSLSSALEEAYAIWMRDHDDSLHAIVSVDQYGAVATVKNRVEIADYCSEREDEVEDICVNFIEDRRWISGMQSSFRGRV